MPIKCSSSFETGNTRYIVLDLKNQALYKEDFFFKEAIYALINVEIIWMRYKELLLLYIHTYKCVYIYIHICICIEAYIFANMQLKFDEKPSF